MGIPVADLDISMQELTEWSAYERLTGPLLVHERIEVMVAILCSLLANVNSSGRKFEPSDFMPSWDGSRRKREQTPEQMIAEFEAARR